MIDLEDKRLRRLMLFVDRIQAGSRAAENSMYYKGAQDAWYLAQLIALDLSDGGASLNDIIELLGDDQDSFGDGLEYLNNFKKPLFEIVQTLITHKNNVEGKNADNLDEP